MIESSNNIDKLLETKENQKFKVFELYNIINEEEYNRIYNILKKCKIANFKNTDEELYLGTNQSIYSDIINKDRKNKLC